MTTVERHALATRGTRPLLEVSNLSVSFRLKTGPLKPARRLQAVVDASFEIGEGETLGLVGESGSGKSTTGRGVLRLVRPDSGVVRMGDTDVTALSRGELRRFRRNFQMVFQDPYSSLDPSSQVGESVGEPLRVHEGLRGQALQDRVGDLFDRVGLSRRHLRRYPYEFSGGQRQRIAIARAIALHPKLVVCDEAVSALDVSTQNQVINLLEDLRDSDGISYLFISHDLGVVRHIADQVAVLYLGRLVEVGPTERIFSAPAHPYTVALLEASPVPDPVRQRARRQQPLQGDMPDPAKPPPGCPFSSRCPHVMDVCQHVMPDPVPVEGGGYVRCHLHGEQGRAAPLAQDLGGPVDLARTDRGEDGHERSDGPGAPEQA